MFSMFAKKTPTETTTFKTVEEKAKEYLKKNCSVFDKNTNNVPLTFYVLEPKSINFIKKAVFGSDEDRNKILTYSYQDKDDKEVKDVKTGDEIRIRNSNGEFVLVPYGQTMWYKLNPFGQTPDKVRFGGKRKTKRKVPRRKTRSK